VIADIYGPDLLIVLLVLIVAIAALAVPLWAIIDAASRPSGAFQAAGSSKGMWISLIAVFWLFTGIVGVILAIVYLASIRPSVRAAAALPPPPINR
jgi:Na+-driven multidrug efflux pump